MHLQYYLNTTMEISDFQELFNYNHKVRHNYIDAFKQKLSWENMIKNKK
jgi:hypothetical protein